MMISSIGAGGATPPSRVNAHVTRHVTDAHCQPSFLESGKWHLSHDVAINGQSCGYCPPRHPTQFEASFKSQMDLMTWQSSSEP
jgi:hypothetical protein